MTSKVPVYGMDGKPVGQTELPAAFGEGLNSALVARAAIADQTQFYQPKGTDPWAGLKTSARYRGRKEDFGSIKNRGISRLPREVLAKGRFGKVRRIASSVKGRRAHPPHVDEKLVEKINKKEYAKAMRAALAASADAPSVGARGHKFPSKLALPIVLDAKSESGAMKTQAAQALFESIGLGADMERCSKTKARTGVGARKGGVQRPKGALVVVASAESAIARAARNIAGMDVVEAGSLTVLDLAPGAKAGRLTVYTQPALDALAKKSI